MSRYIDADELKSAIRKAFPNLMMRVDINSIINEQPTADVVEVKRGEWIESDFGWRCSICGNTSVMWQRTYNYCPNCGADMRGKENGCN